MTDYQELLENLKLINKKQKHKSIIHALNVLSELILQTSEDGNLNGAEYINTFRLGRVKLLITVNKKYPYTIGDRS